MQRISVVGNSGSGKPAQSSRRVAARLALCHEIWVMVTKRGGSTHTTVPARSRTVDDPVGVDPASGCQGALRLSDGRSAVERSHLRPSPVAT
jgi:hypothetical protein